MTYVSYVFRSYFGYAQGEADRLMRQVHEQGRAVVSTGNREQMEVDVQAMHGFGLWATLPARRQLTCGGSARSTAGTWRVSAPTEREVFATVVADVAELLGGERFGAPGAPGSRTRPDRWAGCG